MTAQQISELVLDLYAARKEAKEYLDFFVQPDINEKLEKSKKAITKEIQRTVRRYSRPRMTKVRQYISDISSLNPGAESVAEIMTFAVEEICRTGTTCYLRETTRKNAAKLLLETLRFVNQSGMLDIYLPRINDAVADMDFVDYYCGPFGTLMRDTLQDWFAGEDR